MGQIVTPFPTLGPEHQLVVVPDEDWHGLQEGISQGYHLEARHAFALFVAPDGSQSVAYRKASDVRKG